MSRELTVHDLEVFEALTDEQKIAAGLVALAVLEDACRETEWGTLECTPEDYVFCLRDRGIRV